MSHKKWHRNWYKRSTSRRSPWGGEVASMEDVERLNKKITAHEEKEAQDADAMLDRELKKLS